MLSNVMEYTLFVLFILLTVIFVQRQMNQLIQKKLDVSLLHISQQLTSVFYIFIFFLLVSGFWFVQYVQKIEHEEYKEYAHHFSSVFASELSQMNHQLLNEHTKPTDKTYIRILSAMTRWQHEHPEVLSIYTLKKRADGKNYFVVDPAVDYNRNGRIDGEKEQIILIGTVYTKYIPELERAFRGKFSIEKSPTVDNWGESLGAFHPIFDKEGRVEHKDIIVS